MLNTIIKLLDISAKKYPDKLAISDEVHEFTFKELRDSAKKIASFILKETKGKNLAIPVEVDRSSLTVVLFLGVLYSGNFYVPLDNKMAQGQLSKILNEINPLISLSIKKDSIFSKLGYRELAFEDLVDTQINEGAIKERLERIIDVDPAYMIYTSGSTGSPKGVVISHRSLIDLTEFLSKTFDITEEDKICNQAPFFFDGSVKCIYMMLANGASLYILRHHYFMFPIKTIEFLNEKEITTLPWATAGMNLISSSGVFEKLKPKTLKKVFFAGESLYKKDYLPWKEACPPGTKFINLYGPTEITVDCTYYVIEDDDQEGDLIPIGKACPNMEVFLLDEENRIVENGEVGELCVRGTGVGQGYYKDPEKTKNVFIQNPLNSEYRDIIYKTGDLVYENEKGNLVFVSRKDNQVKHRGHRIELGDLEAATHGIEGVKNAVVFYDDDNKKIVMAYEGDISKKDLLKGLKSRVSAYMLPGKILLYEIFPRTPNGKIDRVGIKKNYEES